MNVLPPAGPERRRLFVLLALLVAVGIYAYFNYFRADTVSSQPTQNARQTSNPIDGLLKTTPQPRPGSRAALAGASDAQMPQALRLDRLEEQLPAEPEAGGRNLFRFGVPPPPPKPTYTPPPTPVGPVEPPPLPQIPPIPLKYVVYTKHPDGKNVASLLDKTGAIFQAVEGDIVDGQYKLLRVTPQSVEMEYHRAAQRFPPDRYQPGTGRRTIALNGG